MGTELPGQGKGPTTRGVRPIFIVVLLLAAFTAIGVAAFSRIQKQREQSRAQQAQAARERAERATPVAAIALAPLPSRSPLVERSGTDSDGYPRSYVDQGALRSLLGRGKYAELSQYLEQFQRELEADFHHEYWIIDASEAFSSAEPELSPSLDAWVAATPASFAPYLARGMHHFSAGWAARGTHWAGETDAGNFAAMNKAFALADADLAHALELAPHAVAALRTQMRMAFAQGRRADFDALAVRSFALCAACFQPRVTQQYGLQPRWGGSFRAMEAAARAAPVALNSRFKLLPGYAEEERAHTFELEKNLPEALVHAQRACKLGDNANFLERLADVLERQQDWPAALAALNRALELRPSNSDLLLARARAETAGAADWPAAYRDLVAALRIEPTSSDARDLVPRIVKGLTFVGWEAHTQGKDDQAIQLLDQAAELDPNRDVEGRRSAVLTSGFHGTDAELAALDAAARAAPHDFYAHERLDYALSSRRDWPRIAMMWGDYLRDNPEDARAYLERSGTLANQGRHAEAHADAARACELGSSAGCSYAKR